MALKNRFARMIFGGGMLTGLVLVFFTPIFNVGTGNGEPTPADFLDFIQQVQNGNVDVLSGVYIPSVLALPVVQQPTGDDGYVSGRNDEATQFSMASRYGNIGLLAHNYLSGRLFSQLAVGEEVRLIYGDGRVEYFVITEVLRYQALEPNSPWSSFRNLESEDILSTEQMFTRAYAGDRHVTFQTCIESNGNASWGRLFVIAVPKALSFETIFQQLLQ
ncbi:MAG TPA: hypothetical protein VFQ23_06605 [Anaerolineales bacterium]|nr:hypothetical protein [Anaerolineales bacterium]